MKTLRWERCRGGRYAGYDGDTFVALIKPVWFSRDGRNKLSGTTVWGQAYTWELYDENQDLSEWGDALTARPAARLVEESYFAAKELLK